jgi:hypothetical protein
LDSLFGFSVDGVPDTNGDGQSEAIVGAPTEEPSGSPTDSGRAYLFDGATGNLLFSFASPNADSQGRFGVSVSGVPDTNGDGRGDILIGASGEDPGGSPLSAGRAYLFSGATGGLLRTFIPPDEESDGFFGIAVTGIADLSGDRRGEVVIGASGVDPGGSPNGAGRVYVFNGSTGGSIRTLASPNEANNGSFGLAVAAVPDTNGNTGEDIIVGAPIEDSSSNDSGRAYLFDGPTGNLLRSFVSPNAEFEGFYGGAVAGVLDTTGDGRGEVLIGARSEDPTGSPGDAGRAYLYNGATGDSMRQFRSPNEEFEGFFGASVEGTADANGDNLGDLLVGAPFEDPGGSPSESGRVYLFDGATGSLLQTLASPNADNDSNFGFALGNLNVTRQFQRRGFVVGANEENPGTSPLGAGRAYVFFIPQPAPDYDVAPDPADGFIDARDLLEWLEGGSLAFNLFDFSRFWRQITRK